MADSTMQNKDSWAVGGGLLIGLGVGFFFLPNGIAFVGSIIAGLGLGLFAAAILSKFQVHS